MTNAEWAVVRPLLPVPGWLRGRGGQPEAYCHRAMLDAIRYLVDNGIKCRPAPADFPPWDRCVCLRRWRDHSLVTEFYDRLRDRVRMTLGRDTEPSAGVIDSQSVKADAVVGSDRRLRRAQRPASERLAELDRAGGGRRDDEVLVVIADVADRPPARRGSRQASTSWSEPLVHSHSPTADLLICYYREVLF
ncbi:MULTISPECIES: transposase [Streptomyces]|uniref:Transposase n=2 Tax=Streptomyces TaxID=1883 RepID=A0ABV9J6L0_9ACTN